GGHATDLLDESGVAAGPEADVVWKDRRALDGADAVDFIGAVQEGNLESARQRSLTVGIGHVRPSRRRVVGRRRTSLAESGSERVLRDVLSAQALALHLQHLAVFFICGHL